MRQKVFENLTIITIDSKSTKALDDAFSFEKISDN